MKKHRIIALVLSVLTLSSVFFIGKINSNFAEADVVEHNGITFHFLNVNSIERDDGGPIGSADCILIDDNGIFTLIDGGTEQKTSTKVVCDYLDDLGVDKITNLIVSHHHNDHVGCFPDIIERFDVVNCYYTLPKDWTKIRPLEMDWGTKYMYDRAITAIREKINSDGSIINIIIPDEEGKVYNVSNDSYFTVYNCKAVIENNYREYEFNDTSMMIKYTYKDVNALFTGDVNIQYEYTLTGEVKKNGERCAKGDPDAIAPVGEIQILKVAHHGTEGSLHSENLLNLLNPNKNNKCVAVVTGYKGNVGKSTVNRLNTYGYQYFITHDGHVQITTDGTINSINTKQIPFAN